MLAGWDAAPAGGARKHFSCNFLQSTATSRNG